MDKDLLFDKCVEYVRLVWDMGQLKMFGIYGLEQMRIALHQEISDICGLDHIETKEVTDNLDIDFSKECNETAVHEIAKAMMGKFEKMRE